MSSFLRINDVFDELSEEIARLRSELIFANHVIHALFKFKSILDSIREKFGETLDKKLNKELESLDELFDRVIKEQTRDDVTKQEEEEEATPTPTPKTRSERKKRPEVKSKYEFACDWIGCDFVTNRRSRLNAHNNYHTGKRPFNCQKCEKAFVGREALTTHEKSVHSVEKQLKCFIRNERKKEKKRKIVLKDEKPFKCPQNECNYRSRTRQALREHRLTHLERTMKCSFESCEKAFKNKKQLKSHVLTHNPMPSYKCPIDGCLAAFRTYKTLKVHRLRHAGKTPNFKCDWPGCEFSSVYNWILRRHVTKHTGERPHRCTWPACESAFRDRTHLKTHLLRHTGERPVACDACAERFQSRQTLAKHVERRHKSFIAK